MDKRRTDPDCWYEFNQKRMHMVAYEYKHDTLARVFVTRCGQKMEFFADSYQGSGRPKCQRCLKSYLADCKARELRRMNKEV